MAEFEKYIESKEFDYSRMGKQTHKDFLKVKPKAPASCSPCSIIWVGGTEGINYGGGNIVYGEQGVFINDSPMSTSTRLLCLDYAISPGVVAANPGCNGSPTVIPGGPYYNAREVAKFGNKFWVDVSKDYVANDPKWLLEFELDTSTNCTTANFIRAIELPFPGSPNSFFGAWTAKNSTTLIGINYTFASPGNPLYDPNIQTFLGLANVECIELDISSSVATSTFLMEFTDHLGNVGNTIIGTDIVYLPTSNSIVTIGSTGSSTATGDYFYHYDMNGNLLSFLEHPELAPPSGNLYNTSIGCGGSAALFTFDQKIYASCAGTPMFGQDIALVGVEVVGNALQAVPSLQVAWDPVINDNYISGSDAATDPSCIGIPFVPPPSGCMDPLALNYDPLATADCNGVVGGNDTSCCEYPCHHPYGWEPPRGI